MKKYWLFIVLIGLFVLPACGKVEFKNSPGFHRKTHKIVIIASIINTFDPYIVIRTDEFELDRKTLTLKVPSGLISNHWDKDSAVIQIANAQFSCPVGCSITITTYFADGKRTETINRYSN